MFGERECHPMSKKANPAALLPILVFLVLYLGLGLIFEYVLKIPMGFYSIPIVVIFLMTTSPARASAMTMRPRATSSPWSCC